MGPSRLEFSKPVIAAVSGAAVAEGMEFAIWCDIRVMEEAAFTGVYPSSKPSSNRTCQITSITHFGLSPAKCRCGNVAAELTCEADFP